MPSLIYSWAKRYSLQCAVKERVPMRKKNIYLKIKEKPNSLIISGKEGTKQTTVTVSM